MYNVYSSTSRASSGCELYQCELYCFRSQNLIVDAEAAIAKVSQFLSNALKCFKSLYYVIG